MVHSIFTKGSSNPATCSNYTIDNVNVVFMLTDTLTDKFVKYVVVTEDPTLTKVTDVSEQFGAYYTFSSTWSGYELWGPSGSPYTPVYEAKGSWTIPTAQQPPISGTCSTSRPCSLAIWTGLTTYALGGDGNLAQAGTDEKLICNPTCPEASHLVWYEFLPSPAVYCTGLGFLIGDSITTNLTNEAKSGGSSSLYDAKVYDNRSGKNCATTGYNYGGHMTSPRYANFIIERATYDSLIGPVTLAKFGTVSETTNTMYYSSASHNIYDAYSVGRYNQDLMQNNGHQNINVGAVDSGGSFTQTWVTSSGT